MLAVEVQNVREGRIMRMYHQLLLLLVVAVLHTGSAGAATLDSRLAAKLETASADLDLGVVIVAFDHAGALRASDLLALQSAGIGHGLTLEELAMVAAPATASQVRALAKSPAVRSIWGNHELRYHLHQATVLGGVDRLRTDPQFRSPIGLPPSGRGDFSVVINDSGIDATHADLQFGNHVVQNVQLLTDTATLSGFTPLLAVENIPDTDTHVGHGTHVAGIAGGTGARSGGLFEGVAPGAKLIGVGSGAGLFILNALGGFEWSLANQFFYGIRVINNSWGSSGEFDPDDPIVIASRKATDRNIVVVFSAGNSGPGLDTLNPYAKAPWVIGVAAGTKEGGLIDFSSRGTPIWERLTDANPFNDFDAPDITAPGSGRGFDINADRFTSDIVSVRASSNVVANGADADLEIAPAFVPFYTQISGTSMSAPFVTGVVALMLEADPTLSPAEIEDILRRTATPMPGLNEFAVGAGYVNVFAAVDAVKHRAKPYGALAQRAVNDARFKLGIAITPAAPGEPFAIDFVPAEPGPDSPNTVPFEIAPGLGLLQVRIDFGNDPQTAETGNAMKLVLHAPDGSTVESGVALPVLDPTQIELMVRDPQPGDWIAEVRGVTGLNTAAGTVSGPTTNGIPERVDGEVKRFFVTTDPVPDIAGHALEDTIRTQLALRRVDVLDDGGFHPDQATSRTDFARTLALNVPLRQSFADSPRFADVDAALRPFAEAVTADGPSLRGFDFTAGGLVSTAGDAYEPDAEVDRLDTAFALVQALGMHVEAQAMAGATVLYQGEALIDNDAIPTALRGYVQIALDIELMEAFPAEVIQNPDGSFTAIPGPRFEPDTVVTRAGLAGLLADFADIFASGL
jgi:serine protease AprX